MRHRRSPRLVLAAITLSLVTALPAGGADSAPAGEGTGPTWQYVSSVTNPGTSTAFNATATCPVGYHAMAGGGYTSQANLLLTDSHRGGSLRSWHVRWETDDDLSANPENIAAVALCRKGLDPAWRYIERTVDPTTDSAFFAVATCPTGFQAVAGAGYSTVDDLFIADSSRLATPSWSTRWETDDNAFVNPNGVTTAALCRKGDAGAWRFITRSTNPGPATYFSATATCPGGYRAMAGGGYTSLGELFMTTSRRHGDGTTGTWYVAWEADNDATFDPSQVTTVALCKQA